MEDKPIKLTIRNAIGVVIFIIGTLVILGAVGSLDYIEESGGAVTHADLIDGAVRVVIGLAVCAAAFPIGGPVYYDSNDDEAQEVEEDQYGRENRE